jgi:hypothetical protein
LKDEELEALIVRMVEAIERIADALEVGNEAAS